MGLNAFKISFFEGISLNLSGLIFFICLGNAPIFLQEAMMKRQVNYEK